MDVRHIYEEESYAVRGAIYEVYKTLNCGFLEDVYQHALEKEFELREIPFEAQKPLKILYKGVMCGEYIPDFVCYDKIIVEIKAVEKLHEKHRAQLLNYLKATGFKLGLLVNFWGFPKVEIVRMVN